MRADEIESAFVDFYASRGYGLLPRASMLDSSIPMSFVMSAGLVQVENSISRMGQLRGGKYVLVQDCFRHFDIEKVGSDSTHLSFFHMPGAFVFGDFGSEEAIHLMWELATQGLRLPSERLWASYFCGGLIEGDAQPADLRVRAAWRNRGLPEQRIVGLGPSNNFWMQSNSLQNSASTRKCGPNTELFYEREGWIACGQGCRPGCDCGRFVEFANSLFVRQQLDPTSIRLSRLETPFTETVIGIERVQMIQGGVPSVFDLPPYSLIMERIPDFIADDKVGLEEIQRASRIIADHLIALFHLIAEGAPPPGKDGRRRIVKILIRRIVTQEFLLEIRSERFLPMLMQTLTDLVGDREGWDDVASKVQSYYLAERYRYERTLDRGAREIERLASRNSSGTLTINEINQLRSKWGVPEVLSRKLLREGALDAGMVGEQAPIVST